MIYLRIKQLVEKSHNKFPDSLKLSNTVPVHKKKDPTDKTNYRPVTILPLLSKVFEKVILIKLNDYMESFLNQLLCGFRKTHSTQNTLFSTAWNTVISPTSWYEEFVERYRFRIVLGVSSETMRKLCLFTKFLYAVWVNPW